MSSGPASGVTQNHSVNGSLKSIQSVADAYEQ